MLTREDEDQLRLNRFVSRYYHHGPAYQHRREESKLLLSRVSQPVKPPAYWQQFQSFI
jgi:hypothetical protein